VKENDSSVHDAVNSGNNIEISKADCSQDRMETVKRALPGVSGCVVNRGIDDPPRTDCTRMTATAVVHGIFESPFSEE
jgi:hypothetical protein